MALVHILTARNMGRVCRRLSMSRNISGSLSYNSNRSPGDDNNSSKSTLPQEDNKIAVQFNQPAVQEILSRITGLDLAKIYRSRPQEESKMPTYKLLTDSEFKAV